MNRPTWDSYFGRIAQVVATRSIDEETQVGCVIVDSDQRIVSTGYNGHPAGMIDLPTTRPDKYPYMIHSEQNALLFARTNMRGCKLYLTMLMPCDNCAKLICQVGINEVIIVNKDLERMARWDFEPTMIMFAKHGMILREINI